MTDTAREIILSNLRTASPARDFAPSDFSVIEEKKLTAKEKIARYIEVTQAVNTEIHDVGSDTWVGDVEAFLVKKGLRHLMYGPTSEVGKEIDQNWRGQGPKLVPYQNAMENCKDVLFDIDASITSTLGAIAETGSLIVWPTKEEPRLLSLTPPIHIAIVRANEFYTTFQEAIDKMDWIKNMPTNALLISGPSKTADIEQELCYGVHGPKELIVFIVH